MRLVPSPLRAAVGTAAVALAALCGFGLSTTPALAHDQLVSSNPEAGAQLDQQPEWIELKFSGDVEEVGSEIQVNNSDGENVSAGELAVEGSTVSSALPDDLDSGDYTIVWRVVSSDGHPISGEIDFSIKDDGGAGGSVSATEGETSGSIELGGGTNTGQGSDNGNPGLGGEQGDSDQTSAQGPSAAVVIAIIVGALAVVGIVAALLVRKSKGISGQE